MKKIMSMLLALTMAFALCIPVSAAEISQSKSEERAYKIQELASLAGRAARSGDYELANSYESRIRALGGEILTYNELMTTMSKMGHVSTHASVINPPPNSDYVHFTKSETSNYRYGANYYDIVTITAVPWSDLAGYLHADGSIATTSPSVYNLATMIATDVLAKTVYGRVTSTLMTMGDYFNALGDSMSNYKTMSISRGDGTCLYAIDMDVNFQWIRLHGNSDYRMMVREARYSEVNYSTSVLASLTHANGKVDTYTYSKDTRTSQTPSGYGNLSGVCMAYQNDKIAEYNAGAFTIYIGSREAVIPALTVPPYMDII